MKTRLLQYDTSTDQGRAELRRLLGEVLQPEHDYLGTFQNCVNCGCNRNTMSSIRKCTHPVPLTWPEAMKWRDWAVEKFGSITYKDSLVDIYCDTVDIGDATLGDLKECMDYLDKFIVWLATKPKPEHYLIASALCVLNSKGGDSNG